MKKLGKIVSLFLATVLSTAAVSTLVACGGGGKKAKSLIIMTDSLDGLFNPFFSTSANDGTIAGMTQIGMLSTDKNGEIAFGDDEPVVVKDFERVYNAATDTTDYTFVIKNGIVFSDGKPLTMNDVLFNMYVYLDPVYTGSSTMYSTDIVGLYEYRYQESETATGEEELTALAASYARIRLQELIRVYQTVGKKISSGSVTYEADIATMEAAIMNHNLSEAYKSTVSNNPAEVTNDQLLADYRNILTKFQEELARDYEGAKDAYVDAPYSTTGEFDEITSFMYNEGYVNLKYEKKTLANGKETDDKSKIKEVNRTYSKELINTKEKAIEYVYVDQITTHFHEVAQYWATAQEVMTEYTAKAKDVLLSAGLKDGELLYPNVSGIKSLGHTTDVTTVTVNGNTYTVAQEYNEDGTVKNAGEYAVLRITINGVDPKAVFNFAFTVAPQHVYAKNQTVDIKNNKFGVVRGDWDFMKDEIQSATNNKLPIGAGPYKATDTNNSDNPTGATFFSDNIVYFKANDLFLLGAPKIKNLQYKIVPSSQALNALQNGEVHFVTPQYTSENANKIDDLKKKGYDSVSAKQLGYGYIGVNAGKIKNIYLRRAIMSAMDTSLALQYYSAGTAQNIAYPLSLVSWAYPKNSDGTFKTNNGKDYTQFSSDDAAIQKIQNFMKLAGVQEGDKQLSIKFTIAGSDMYDHPTFQTFLKASELLNACGWNIEVVSDTNALTKIATGSLSVWAAAWGATIDPDMYQVYHKNSSATSTTAWGYREILASPSEYPQETQILNKLATIIDAARETDVKSDRITLYEEAMGYVLDLAIEMPVYQRETLYVYNTNVIKKSTLPTKDQVNPYSSPLDRIWEIELVD